MKLSRLILPRAVCLLVLMHSGIVFAADNDLHPFFVQGGPTGGGAVEPLPVTAPAADRGVVVTEDGREYPWTSVNEDSPLASSSSFTPVNKRDQAREHPLRLFDSMLGSRSAAPETAAASRQPGTAAGTSASSSTGLSAFPPPANKRDEVREHPFNLFGLFSASEPKQQARPEQKEPQAASTTPAAASQEAAAAPAKGGGLSDSDSFTRDRRGDKPVREYPINWF